jgi:hypothetical protein
MIVIPMAGKSRRFAEAGYTQPKYMLPLHGRSVFAHAVDSFRAYFASTPLLFIAGDVEGAADFIKSECRALGVADARVHVVNVATAGQAETVELGLKAFNVGADVPVTIFNIDTFRPGFSFPQAAWFAKSDGYLEVFEGSGANWSYVRPAVGSEPVALETAEKRPISNLCCSGLYHFARVGDFHTALAQERKNPSAAELYVAPIYKYLITAGLRIHYNKIPADEVIFCGVPAEYEWLLKKAPTAA